MKFTHDSEKNCLVCDEDNIRKINNFLKIKNGRSTRNTVGSAASVLILAKNFIRHLYCMNLNISERAGAFAIWRDGGATANAYKKAMNVSELSFRVGADGRTVHLVDAEVVEAWPKSKAKMHCSLTEKSRASWLARMGREFGIAPKTREEIAAAQAQARAEEIFEEEVRGVNLETA